MAEIVRERSEKGNGHSTAGLSPWRKRELCLLFDFFERLLETAHFPAPVAQLDRVPASEAVGCGFDPRRVQFFPWSLLQLENWTQITDLKIRREWWSLGDSNP